MEFVCNAFPFFEKIQDSLFWGRREEGEGVILILLYVEIQEKKRETHMTRNLSLFLKECKQRTEGANISELFIMLWPWSKEGI